MKNWLKAWPVGLLLILAGGIVAAFLVSEGLREWMLGLLERFKEMGPAGVIFYTLFYTVMVLLTVPAVIFTFGSGFVFGFWIGSAAIIVAIALGSSLAFLIGRHAFGKKAERFFLRHEKLRQLDKGMTAEGWKIVMLSRLVPGFPFKLSNYFFGLTSVSFKGFFVGNLLGILPMMLLNVYVGSVAGDLEELLKKDRGVGEWVLYGVGALAAVGLLYYLRRMAKQSLDQMVEAGAEAHGEAES
jgi:uncharacterized membrane protein YdjX (TVP38/TMEM64 family)